MKARDVLSAMFGNARLPLAATAVAVALLAVGVGIAAAVAPVVTVEDATNVEYTTADVEGTVNPEGQGTSWRFEYATAADFSDAQEGLSGFTETEEPVSGQLTGLQPGTTYHLRLLAENGDGQSEAVAASTFETKPVAKPIPGEPQVSSITGHTASFEATVNPNAPEDNSLLTQAAKDAYATHWWFTCEPGCGFSGPSEGDVEADDSPVNVAAEATGLDGNTEYTVFLHVSNAGGTETSQALFTTSLIAPDVGLAVLDAYDPTDTTATLQGSVNPQNSPVTQCRFVYGLTSASGNEAPCSPQVVAFSERQDVFLGGSISGGQWRLIFESEATEYLPFGASVEALEEALEALPAIGSGNVTVLPGVEFSSSQQFYSVIFDGDLAGKDVPQLEMDASQLFGEDVVTGIQTAVPPSLSRAVRVSAALSGLSSETEYHYKLIVTNAGGTTESPERSFRTLAVPQSQSCANGAVRAEQHSTNTECRGYEMVSPADKNGANVTAEATNILAATDGNAAVFQSRGGFAGTVGSGRTGFTQYLSRRSSSGWATKAITPTPPGSAVQALSGGTELFYFSDLLDKAILWGYDLPAKTDDVANNDNLYRLDTGSGALETVTLAAQKTGPIGANDFLGKGNHWGASRDTGVVSFASNTRFLPEATPGKKNAYEWDHGTLRLAGILPNGTVPAGGSTPPTPDNQGYRDTVSDDGSRVLFASPFSGAQQLYMRRDHSDTVWITEPEFGSPGQPKNVLLVWVSPDAEKILFETTTSLVAGDADSDRDLYLYTDSPDPDSDSNLTLISASGNYRGQDGFVASTNDADRIYYRNADETLVFWDEGNVTPVAPVEIRSEPSIGPVQVPGPTRLTEDGRFLAFYSHTGSSPDGSGLTGAEVMGTGQLYLYDAEEDTLACVSCRRGARTSADTPEEPSVNQGGVRKSVQGLRPRYLADDGRVFFSSPAPLVAEDTNGVMDVYAYDPRTGQQVLVTSGKGEEGQWFVNASESGDDVFFATNQSLVGGDPDTITDLYDARVGGGFPEPPPPPTPCVGDNCRGALSAPVGGASPGTATFSGPGNPRCRPHKSGRKHCRCGPRKAQNKNKKHKASKCSKQPKQGKKRHQRKAESSREGGRR